MRKPTYYFDNINSKKIHTLMSTCDIMDLSIFTPTGLVSVWIILPLAEAYLWGQVDMDWKNFGQVYGSARWR